MYWRILALALAAWAALTFFDKTLGGFIHVVPVVAVLTLIVRRMAKQPDSEFGRWRAPGTPRDGRR